LSPSNTTVAVGSSFAVDIIADGINLGGYDLVLDFNPALVGLSAVVPDILLGDPSMFESFFDSSPGLDTVHISAVSLLDSAILLALQGTAPGNSFRLATLTFEATAAGLAQFNFGEALLTGLDANQVSASFAGATVEIGSVETPVPVPEPVTWMVLPGLLLIILGRAAYKRPLQ
jgi:hypothetical protein